MRLAKTTIPKTRKKTKRASSLAEALNVWIRIFKPGEWRVSLNNLKILMMLMKSTSWDFVLKRRLMSM
jgi:hypothetical protein